MSALIPTARSPRFAPYRLEARNELRRYLRMPGFLIPVMLFPAIFYVMFGVLLARPGSDAARYLLSAYSTFGVMAPGLFGFGVSLAMERESGLLTLKRAMPAPPLGYLVGKMTMALLMSAVVIALLIVLARSLGHVPVTAMQMAALYATHVPGSLAFCALGLLLGTMARGQAAPAVINMLYLPMAFLSGLWFPVENLPRAVQAIAPVLPSYHLNQLGLRAVGLGEQPRLPHAAFLVAFTVVALLLAARRLRRVG